MLHPTFSQPLRTVSRTPSNPICKLTIWTWGIFRVDVVVHDRRGTLQRLNHDLQYEKELQDPKAVFEKQSM